MAQLNSASDFGSEGWGFESLRGHCKHKPCNKIAGFVVFQKNEVKLQDFWKQQKALPGNAGLYLQRGVL